MSVGCLRLLLALGLTTFATLAPAQVKKAAPKFAVPGSPDSASMGSKDLSSRGRRAPSSRTQPNAAIATFPGFRLLPDGSSRIYVELTRQVSVEERRAEGMLIYVLHDARVPVRNNRNALLTTHFATPVARARLHAKGRDVELFIDLRKAVTATQRIVPGDNGGARLEVDFPPGDYPLAPGLFEPPARDRSRESDSDTGEEPAAPPGAAAGARSSTMPPSSAPAVPSAAAPQGAPANAGASNASAPSRAPASAAPSSVPSPSPSPSR